MYWITLPQLFLGFLFVLKCISCLLFGNIHRYSSQLETLPYASFSLDEKKAIGCCARGFREKKHTTGDTVGAFFFRKSFFSLPRKEMHRKLSFGSSILICTKRAAFVFHKALSSRSGNRFWRNSKGCQTPLKGSEENVSPKSPQETTTKPQETPKSTNDQRKKKSVIVLGGDGFCGWPSALYLSDHGYSVTIVDNLSRRNIDNKLGTRSLTPISSIQQRVMKWNEITNKTIHFQNIDIATEYAELLSLIDTVKPETIVHFAEQRAAPYSMKSVNERRYTVRNNVLATHNLLLAALESQLDLHIVHLGTMGVYGYDGNPCEIPEGYLNVKLEDGSTQRILYPADPGSVYHLTKCLDALMFQFYNKNDKIKITDLHQGVVWGTNTPQTLLHEMLINRFDYDSDYGTVLNRFLLQSALDIPLTVYGNGGQTRAFIHITDTCKCIKIAIENPPALNNTVQIFNQISETLCIRDVAKMISEKTGAKLSYIPNPRKEAAENNLLASNKKFRSLGWNPILLNDQLLAEVRSVAIKYQNRCDKSNILPVSFWNKEREEECRKSF